MLMSNMALEMLKQCSSELATYKQFGNPRVLATFKQFHVSFSGHRTISIAEL